jgi:hypothetical protein
MRADVDLLPKEDAGVEIVEKDGGPGVSLDQAFLDGGELFAPAEVVLDLGDQGIECLARGGAPVKRFDVEQLGKAPFCRLAKGVPDEAERLPSC